MVSPTRHWPGLDCVWLLRTISSGIGVGVAVDCVRATAVWVAGQFGVAVGNGV